MKEVFEGWATLCSEDSERFGDILPGFSFSVEANNRGEAREKMRAECCERLSKEFGIRAVPESQNEYEVVGIYGGCEVVYLVDTE